MGMSKAANNAGNAASSPNRVGFPITGPSAAPTAVPAGSPATVATTPKEAPNTRTATAMGAAESRMRRTCPRGLIMKKTGAGGVRRQLCVRGFLAAAERRDPFQDLQRLPDEGRDVLRLTRGHQVSIDHDLLVNHVGAHLAEILLDGGPGRQFASLHDPGRDQQLRSVANRQDGLSLVEERFRELDHPGVVPELVR